MAHKKGMGSSRNGRDSNAQRLGVKVYGSQEVKAGAILVVNTPEPPELVEENPDLVYQLVDEDKKDRGVQNATKFALKAIESLER